MIDLKLPNYYKILRLIYNKQQDFIGYLMTYYQKEDIDILTTKTEYTLDMMNQLLISSKILTNYGILIADLKPDNIVLTSSSLTVIDIDNYAFATEFSKEQLLVENQESINRLFKLLYTETLINHREYLQSGEHSIFDLFYHSNTIDDITKKLSLHKYPIDYIKANSR